MTSLPQDKLPADAPNLLTLAEASKRTGLTVDALRKRIRRGLLDVVKGNDGLVRVRLPASDMAGQGLADGQPMPSLSIDNSREIKALEDMVAAMRERAEKAEAARDKAQAEAAEQRSRADRAEGAVDGLREALAEARLSFWRRWLR